MSEETPSLKEMQDMLRELAVDLDQPFSAFLEKYGPDPVIDPMLRPLLLDWANRSLYDTLVFLSSRECHDQYGDLDLENAGDGLLADMLKSLVHHFPFHTTNPGPRIADDSGDRRSGGAFGGRF